MNKHRVIAYIDGFNLYYGLKAAGLKRYLWLDVEALVRKLLLPGQVLQGVHYFTALVKNDIGKERRQKAYLSAISCSSLVHIHYGIYQLSEQRCPLCNGIYKIAKEKQSDVNLASELLLDAFSDRFDSALLISGDGDLTKPVESIPKLFEGKNVNVAFPPLPAVRKDRNNRISEKLKASSATWKVIKHKKIASSQLDNPVILQNGREFWRPVEWS